jgi:hypothetical protein
MNRALFFILVLGAVLSGCTMPKDNADKKLSLKGGIPELKLNKEMYNFGRIKEGDVVGKYVWLKNEGTGALIISDIRPNCDCIEVKYDKKPVEPGDSARLEVIFDTNGFYGRQVKFLKVFSNDKRNKEIEIMFWADIEGR